MSRREKRYSPSDELRRIADEIDEKMVPADDPDGDDEFEQIFTVLQRERNPVGQANSIRLIGTTTDYRQAEKWKRNVEAWSSEDVCEIITTRNGQADERLVYLDLKQDPFSDKYERDQS